MVSGLSICVSALLWLLALRSPLSALSSSAGYLAFRQGHLKLADTQVGHFGFS